MQLIDFNPFGPVTDGLMFTWDELERFKTKAVNSASSDTSDTEVRNTRRNPREKHETEVRIIT